LNVTGGIGGGGGGGGDGEVNAAKSVAGFGDTCDDSRAFIVTKPLLTGRSDWIGYIHTFLVSTAVFFRGNVGDSNRIGLYVFLSGVGLEFGVHTGGSCSAADGDGLLSILRDTSFSGSGDLRFSSGDHTPAQRYPFPLTTRWGLSASTSDEINSSKSHTTHMLLKRFSRNAGDTSS